MDAVDYADVRDAAYSFVELDAFGENPPLSVRLTGLDAAALTKRKKSWSRSPQHGVGPFDWERLARKYCRGGGRDFHAALWMDHELCGLIVGALKKDHSELVLSYMESKPNDPRPLKGQVSRILFAAAEYYCLGLGVPKLVIDDPVTPLIPRYEAFGFRLARRSLLREYMERDVGSPWMEVEDHA